MSRFIRRALPFLAIAAIAGAACEVPIKKAPPKPAPPTEVGPAPPGVQPDTCAATTMGLDPFTQDELENTWGPDRQEPSVVASVSFGGRDCVAHLHIDSDQVVEGSTDGFRLTEGLANPPDATNNTPGGFFGNAVQIDLYLDPAWEGTAVRAGFWVVGDTGDERRDGFFGILEFTNIEPSTGGETTITDDHEGWRIWRSGGGGWLDLPVAFTYGEWVTLRIELDTDAEEYNYFVNGEPVGTAPGGDQFIREVWMNHFNFGTHTFPALNTDSYTGHWHAGV